MKAFVINARDNVATALDDLAPGEVTLFGEGEARSVASSAHIRAGHKIALVEIAANAAVIKYGVAIGTASRRIPAGTWIHLHNLASEFDARSGTLDLDTGAPTEEDVYQ